MSKCACGCGRIVPSAIRGERKYYDSNGCHIRNLKNRVMAGQVKPYDYKTCPSCGNVIPVYRGLPVPTYCPPWMYADDPIRSRCWEKNRGKKIKGVPRPQIAKKLAARKVQEEVEAEAPHDRRTHCYRVPTGDWRRVECARYNDTCGAGCYRKDIDCFVWPHSQQFTQQELALIGLGVCQV